MTKPPEVTRAQVLSTFRSKNPNLAHLTDDQILTAIGQEAPNIIRHLVDSGDKDAARFSATPQQVVQGVQDAPANISRLFPGGKELMTGYMPGPKRASLPIQSTTPPPVSAVVAPAPAAAIDTSPHGTTGTWVDKAPGGATGTWKDPVIPVTPKAQTQPTMPVPPKAQTQPTVLQSPISTQANKEEGLTDQQLDAMSKGSEGLTDEQLDAMSSEATKSHGATGSFTEPGLGETIARKALTPLANFGQNAYEAAGKIAHSPIDIATAATTVQNPGEEKLPFVGLAAKRLLYEPTVENAKAWWKDMQDQAANRGPGFLKSAADAMGMIPIVGPIVKEVANQALSGDVSGAAGKALVYSLAPKVAEEATGAAVGAAKSRMNYAQSRPLLHPTPEGHLQMALKPDLDQAGMKMAVEHLKAGEHKLGAPVKDIDSARAADKAQFDQELMPTRRAIIDPQKNVTVPGSMRQMIQAKVDAIPKDIIPGTPDYANLVKNIKASIPKDLTIGELENISTSLNSQNRALHSSKFGAALSKLESANGAIDAATEQASRRLMQEGMDKNGLGGADQLRQVNKQIGVGIKLRDAIDTAETTARTEANMPAFRRLTKRGGDTVNEGIANSMRTAKSGAAPITPNLRPITQPGRQLAANNSINLGPSPDTSAARGQQAIYTPPGRPRMITAQAGGPIALPENMHPETMEPGVTGQPATPAVGPFKTATPQTLEGEQQPLQPTVVKPTGRPAKPLFGERQTNLGETTAQQNVKVPTGSKLAFKSKTLDGKELFHYEAPDGGIITVDHELDLDKGERTKASNFSTYKTPPPPKRTSKNKL